MLALTFEAHGISCAIACRHVVEVLPLLPLEPLPGDSGARVGILVFRERALPAIDVSVLVGGGPSPKRMSTRVVVVRGGDLTEHSQLALVCASVQGVRVLGEFVDGAHASGAPLYFESVRSYERAPVHCLAVDRLMSAFAPNGSKEGGADASHRALP